MISIRPIDSSFSKIYVLKSLRAIQNNSSMKQICCTLNRVMSSDSSSINNPLFILNIFNSCFILEIMMMSSFSIMLQENVTRS